MTKLKEDNLVAQWEQKVIEYVMRTSYSNIDTIKAVSYTHLTLPTKA